eukprot:4748001-Prymnesium_polylepis.1
MHPDDDPAPEPPADMPVVEEALERARGDRNRDPAELQSGPAVSVVRRRDKRVELAGNLYHGNGSALDRLGELAGTLEPEEGPEEHDAVREALGSPKPGVRAA